MQIIDMVLLLAFAVAAWFGYQKGFLIELLSLLAVILAFAVAWRLSHTAVVYLSNTLDWNPRITGALAFIVIMILVFYVTYWISKILTDIVHQTPFGIFDKAFGALLSIFKWAFLLSLILWVLDTSSVKWYIKLKEEAIVLPWCEKIAPTLFNWVRVAVPFEDVFGQIKRSFQ